MHCAAARCAILACSVPQYVQWGIVYGSGSELSVCAYRCGDALIFAVFRVRAESGSTAIGPRWGVSVAELLQFSNHYRTGVEGEAAETMDLVAG